MIYEFDISVRVEAGDEDEARDKLGDWIAAPMPTIYALGIQEFTPRDVTAEEQAA